MIASCLFRIKYNQRMAICPLLISVNLLIIQEKSLPRGAVISVILLIIFAVLYKAVISALDSAKVKSTHLRGVVISLAYVTLFAFSVPWSGRFDRLVWNKEFQFNKFKQARYIANSIPVGSLGEIGFCQGLDHGSWAEEIVYDSTDQISLRPEQTEPLWRLQSLKVVTGEFDYYAIKVFGHFYNITIDRNDAGGGVFADFKINKRLSRRWVTAYMHSDTLTKLGTSHHGAKRILRSSDGHNQF